MGSRLCQGGILWLESESLELAPEDEWPGPVPAGGSHLLPPLLQRRCGAGLRALVHACWGAESWQTAGVSDGASLGRQAAKAFQMYPGGRNLTLNVGKRKEGQ